MYCHECGTQLAENVKFCFNCGQPVKQNIASPTTKTESTNIKTEPPMQGNTIRCPLCGRNDKIQKVSSIVTSQTREIDGGSWETEVYVDKKGKKHAEDHYNPYSATEQTELAQGLSMPEKPTMGSYVGNIIRGIPLLILILGLTLFLMPALIPPRAWLDYRILDYRILSCVIGLAFLVISTVKYRKRADNFEKVETPAWENAIARWKQLYYCFRDDSVFVPSEEAVPISQMTEYLYR